MTTSAFSDSQRAAAKIVGLTYLPSFVLVVAVNFAIFDRFAVRGNPAETARNILANETLFRVGIVGDLMYCVAVVLLTSALYVLLKPVNQHLALLAASGRLIFGLSWLSVTLNLFTSLRLLSDPSYSSSLGAEQAANLARLYRSGYDAYYVGLLFWAMGAAIGGYLWYKSGYIPKTLAAFGIISSVWCAICTITYYIFPNFDATVNLWWFDSPMVVFELVVSFWLLFKRMNPSANLVAPTSGFQ